MSTYRTWKCPGCEQMTNQVEEIDPTSVPDTSPGVLDADGGHSPTNLAEGEETPPDGPCGGDIGGG